MKKIISKLGTYLGILHTSGGDHTFHRQEDNHSQLLILVHGFTGGYQSTWGEFPDLITNDTDLDGYDVLLWGYPTSLLKKSPEISRIGERLKTELDLLPERYQHIVIAAHSMGGLVVRATVVSALTQGKRADLVKLQHIVLFGTPNEGLGKARIIPRFVKKQIGDMQKTSDFIIDLRKQWLDRVYRADKFNDEYHLEIPTTAVAGLEDRFVPPDSVSTFFNDCETTDGDHRGMVKPPNASHTSFKILRKRMLQPAPRYDAVLKEPKTELVEKSVSEVKNSLESKIVHPAISQIAEFTGRADELAAIDDLLFGLKDSLALSAALTDADAAPATLQGMGGVGKSVLAKQYAWKHRDRFAGIWWLRAETAETLDADLLSLGTRFITGIDADPDHERAVQTVIEELARQGSIESAKPWLLIYDNAEQPQQIEKRIPRQGVRLLITSRWTDWHPIATELPIDTFPPKTAINFLLGRAHEEDSDSADALSSALGYLPLALEHARTYCWQTHCSFESYRSRAIELIKSAPANSPYQATAYATFDLAIGQAAEQCSAVNSVMSALSFLAPESIPLDILTELTDSEDQKDAVLGALTTVSLLNYTPLEDGTAAVSQHRLVNAVAGSRIKDNREDLLGHALSALIALWPGGNDGAHPANWPVCARLLPHASTLLDHANTASTNDEAVALLASFVGLYLGARGQIKTGEKWERMSLEISQRVLGEEHPDTAASYNNVAYNLNAQGRYEEAEPLFRHGLEIRQRVLGEEHPDTAASYNNVASNLNAQGRYEEAEPLFRQGLEISQRVLGEEHPDTAASYNNVASNLDDQGRNEEAEPLYRQGLEIRQRVLGEEHPSTAASYNNVACNLDDQGRYEEAEPLFRQGLEIRQRVLGEEHPSTAASYNNVASNLNAQGRYEEAEPLFRQGLEISQRVLGEEHPDTAASYNNVAYNLNAQGRYEEAEPLYRQGLEIRQRVLGEEHPDTAASYNNVASNLDDQGRNEEAEPLYRKAVSIAGKVLGPEHPTTQVLKVNLEAFLEKAAPRV